MYSKLVARVKFRGNYSDYFHLTTGLMQGESISHTLYSLYVRDIEGALESGNCEYLTINDVNLYLLMYADDTVLLSESPENLQNMLNTLSNYCYENNLNVNVNNSKIVIFKNGGKIRENETWTYEGKDLEIVKSFNYLGVVFNHNGKFSLTQKTIAQQASKACFGLQRIIHENYFNLETSIALVSTCIVPILNYCSEVWGFHSADDVERVQITFFKKILGVRTSTCNALIYHELGLCPLQIYRKICMIKYWLKLLKGKNMLLVSCYSDMYDCLLNGKSYNPWLDNVKCILEENGFGNVWISQGVSRTSIYKRINTTS
ncbi:hypothetical protein SNE40_016429 [Patella caerulea]|uniref:Reverse transcriptase domain-containing protein n=1 Tax=Patella caerulea TaxID=87958 RepID=A0AAN8J967_PATCE